MRFIGAFFLVVALLLIVGGTLSLAYDRGVEPRQVGAWAFFAALGVLIGLTLLRHLLHAVGILAPAPKGGTSQLAQTDTSQHWPPQTMARVQDEIRAGRTWRAKEILGGQVGFYPYAPELYGALGEVLLQMGDDIEAGKYLFLGGRNDAQALAAIDLYLSRYSEPQQLFASFPSKAKLQRLEDYPSSVSEELRRRRVKPRVSRSARQATPETRLPWPWLGTAWLAFLGTVFFAALLLGGLVLLAALGSVF